MSQMIAGGSGAGPGWNGTSGVQTHITNTPIGDVERRYPVLLYEFSIRKGSRGVGKFNGGNGVVRDIKVLQHLLLWKRDTRDDNFLGYQTIRVMVYGMNT